MEKLIFIDLCLAFGLRSACRIFNDFADILEWILKYWALIQFLLHYLDDFFLTGPAGSNVCAVNLEKAKLLCLELGVPLAPEKTIGPSTIMPYLGIELDSVEFEARLPLDKLLKAKDLVLKWLSKRSGKKRKLLSLIGYLQHCCKVIVPAPPFLRRLIDLSTTVQSLDMYVHLTWEVKCDLEWWYCLLNNWNGKSFFLMERWITPANFEVSSDAARSVGCGALLGSFWFALRWPNMEHLPEIAVLELVPLVLAASVWGDTWSNQRIRFSCDNLSVVQVLQKKSSKNPHLLKLLRNLTFFAVKFNFDYSAVHVEGKENPAADSLSRFQFQVFRELCPEAYEEPTDIDRSLFKDLLCPP